MVQVGVILCGCGRFDGSEIHEAVLTLTHLAKAGATVRCFAPDAPQWAVCEHFEGAAQEGESRNMLAESARIARGAVEPLDRADPRSLDALVMPGGTGAARNLCDFGERGARGSVLPELDALLRSMHAAGKPIGAICIAPAIVALSLGAHRPRLSLGAVDSGPAVEAAATGAEMVACAVDAIVVDEAQRIVCTPAYILAQGPHEVDAGIGKLVAQVLAWCG